MGNKEEKEVIRGKKRQLRIIVAFLSNISLKKIRSNIYE